MSEMECPNRWKVTFDLETERDIRAMSLTPKQADDYRDARHKSVAHNLALLADASARASVAIQEGFRTLAHALTRRRES